MSSSVVNSTTTSELLDLLEREMDVPPNARVNTINTSNSRIGGSTSSNHCRYSHQEDPGNVNVKNNDGDNNNTKLLHQNQRRGSETSLDSSFTSKLLGGYADDDDDDDDQSDGKQKQSHPPQQQQQQQQQPSPALPSSTDDQDRDHNNNNNNNNKVNTNNTNNNIDLEDTANENNNAQSLPLPLLAVNTVGDSTNNTNHHQGSSDTNSSFSGSHGGGNSSRTTRVVAKRGSLLQQHSLPQSSSSFDNPFHRGSTTTLNHLVESSSSDNNSGSKRGGGRYYGDLGGEHHTTTTTTSSSSRKSKIGKSGRTYSSSSPHAKEGTNMTTTTTTRAENKRAGGHHHRQHSVSFSVEEDWKHDHHEDDNNYQDNTNNNTNNSIVPSSLGSLVSYASRSSGGSRSGKSSRGSGASTATGSTHSSGGSNHSLHAQQERRRRRELTPVHKKVVEAGSSTTTTSTKTSKKTMTGNVNANHALSGISSSSRRSRRKESTTAIIDSAAGGRGGGTIKGLGKLYNNRHGGGTGASHRGKDLHEHHPVRFPKRSSVDDEDQSDAEAAAAEEDYDDNDDGDEEEGLFQRVNKVRNELLQSKDTERTKSEFLDGLIASTTGQPVSKYGSGHHRNSINNTTNDDNDNDGTASVGETSFLSDLLMKNSAARQRKAGQSGHSRSTAGGGGGDSTTSSVINIYKKNDDGAQQQLQQKQFHNIYQQCQHNYQLMIDSIMKFYDHVMSLIRRSTIRQDVERYYYEGGDILPRNRREIAVMLVWALLVLPLVRVVVIHTVGGNDGSGYANEMSMASIGVQSALISAEGDDIMASIWEESSVAMLSKTSTLHENFILIPDTVWIELQISRSKGQSSGNTIKLPKRLPLPAVIDHEYSSPSSMVLFYVTAVNSTGLLLSGNMNSNPSKRNIRLNTRLFEAMQERLKPRPIDVWPCWAHNSLAHFREDGLIAMYPSTKRREARVTMKRLANAFGQSTIYEFITTSDRAKSERRVGSDGSEIIIPGLRNERSDIMIRRSLSTDPMDKDGAGPAVVMRRVKSLAVEDELTMREWEGPPLDKVIWNRVQ